MIRLAAVVIVALLAAADAPARAEITGEPSAAPEFSSAEKDLVQQDVRLAVLARTDPWSLRRALDLLEKQRQSKGAKNAAADDLRSSPEALNDLFQLLKQVKEQPSQTQKK